MTSTLPSALRAAALASITAAACTLAAAQTVGNFETGTLAGWTSIAVGPGPNAIVSTPSIAMAGVSSPYTPLQGAFSALLVAVSQATPGGPYGSCAVDVWNASCPQPLPFTAGGGPALAHQLTGFGGALTRGSIIGRDVSLQAGQTLNWSWRTFGEANCGSLFCVDNAWFFATDGVRTRSVIAGPGLSTASVNFDASGSWTVFFGIGQTEDPQGYSALLLDQVVLVPEPGTLGLLLAGLGGLAAQGQRKRRNRQTLS